MVSILSVLGAVPLWLKGSFYRVGPGIIQVGVPRTHDTGSPCQSTNAVGRGFVEIFPILGSMASGLSACQLMKP